MPAKIYVVAVSLACLRGQSDKCIYGRIVR